MTGVQTCALPICLIDTAVKTANSGYIQRCVIKMMESLHVAYDYTVRESDGSIIQFMYGDDGIDVMKSAFLDNVDFWAQNYEALVAKYETQSILEKFRKGYSSAMKMQKKCMSHPEKYDPVLSKYSPANNLAACSEKYFKAVDDYIKADKNGDFESGRVNPESFRMMMMLKYNRALVNPGEPVGIIAGQSIGEPCTQMTLNTFHLAGRGDVNVTLGIPRIKELVMFAKKEIETPSMILHLKNPNKDNTEALAKKLTKVTLSNIVEGINCIDSIVVKEERRRRKYAIRLALAANYKDIIDVDTESLSDKLKRELLKEIARSQKIKAGVDVVYKGVSGEEAEVGGALEEDEAMEEKKRKGKFVGKDEDDKSSEEENSMSEEENVEGVKEEEKMEEDEISEIVGEENKAKTKQADKKHINVDILLNVNDKVSMVSVVEKVIGKIVLYECPKIKRGIALSKKLEGNTQYYVMTEGVNLKKVVEFSDLVDVDTIETNDVYSVLKMYGVEAARAVLIREIGSVFKGYGIDVDPRHLNLVGDYMMYEGEYKSYNRVGMENNPSPFTKMTFETSLAFLSKACISGQVDNLESPSGSIIMGKNISFGTGAFDLYNDLSHLQ